MAANVEKSEPVVDELPQEAKDKKDAGNAAFAQKKYDDALGLYSEAIKAAPEAAMLYSNRSLAYGSKGDWAAAEADAKTCLEKDMKFIKGYYRLANAQIELGEFEPALVTIRKGLELEDKNAELLKLLRIVKAKKSAAAAATRRGAAGVPARGVDEAARQEAAELSEQLQQTSAELQQTAGSLNSVRREAKLAELTATEVNSLSTDTTVYRAVGKMFLKSSTKEVTGLLQEEKGTATKKEADLSGRVSYLQRRMQSQETSLKEIMSGASRG